MTQFDLRNVILSVILVAFSFGMGLHAYRNINLGTAASMGPGYFPLMLSTALGILSAGIMFIPAKADAPKLRLVSLKVAILILGAPVLFALTIRSLGLVPGVAATVFGATFASRFATFASAVLLTLGFTFFCVVVFFYLLNLPLPLWGTLITG